MLRSEWLALKQQYKNLQRHEYEKLKKTTKILKSEKVRRKELKEKRLNTTSSKNKTLTLAHEEIKDENFSDQIKSENRKRKLEESQSLDTETQPIKKKANLSNYEMETGSVARISTTGENLTKDMIKVSILYSYNFCF